MLKYLLPQAHVNTIYEIDLAELRKQGVKGIITDLDNTLVGADEPLATPELVAWLKEVEQSGFKVMIVSNNRKDRVAAFADPLSIPYIYRARKPYIRAFRKALKKLDLSARESVVVGDQLMTDVLGANRMGIHTIWVKPIALQAEGWGTKFNRRLERWVISRLKKKGWISWEDRT